MAASDKRKYPRVPIFAPISYISIDSEGKPLSQNLGPFKMPVKSGSILKLSMPLIQNLPFFSFVDLDKKLVEIKGRIVYSKQKQSGKFESDISLQGTSAEMLQFITKLVRTYHYTKKDPRKLANCSNRN